MRILLVNDGFGDAGGVQNYLDAIAAGLTRRGHALAILHRDAKPAAFADAPTLALPQFTIAHDGIDPTLGRVRGWQPDVCFSHNMNVLALDRRLVDEWPTVKFMHGYSGICVSGQKRFGFPVARPCGRPFGIACLALYGPRHCGELSIGRMLDQYRWAREQHELLERYAAIVVASAHMKDEYVANGLDASRVHVNPLFPTHHVVAPANGRHPETVAFVGRMTHLKGGELLVEAIAGASARLGRPIELLLVGDGPQRAKWEQLATARRVPCTAAGWVNGEARWTHLARATVLAVPSTWPEPFGLVGLEAGALGVPAVAFDVGGVREWLRPGVNGELALADPPTAAALTDALVAVLGDAGRLRALADGARRVAREMSLDRHLDALESTLAASRRGDANPAGR